MGLHGIEGREIEVLQERVVSVDTDIAVELRRSEKRKRPIEPKGFVISKYGFSMLCPRAHTKTLPNIHSTGL